MKSKSVLSTVLLFAVLTFAMVTLQASASVTRDIAIIDVRPFVGRAYVGETVAINVTVKNMGTDPDAFDITAFYGNMTANYTITTLPTPTLNPGENTTLTFHWSTIGVKPCQNYTIKANCTLIGDPTPDDNEFVDGKVKINMFADINGDGVVDIKDIVLLTKAFGSQPGHPRWNPDADLDNDDKVSIVDLMLVLKNFGKTCL
jgi:hypothetical protein